MAPRNSRTVGNVVAATLWMSSPCVCVAVNSYIVLALRAQALSSKYVDPVVTEGFRRSPRCKCISRTPSPKFWLRALTVGLSFS